MPVGIATHSTDFAVGPGDAADRLYAGPPMSVLLTITIREKQTPGGVQVMLNGAVIPDGLLLAGSTETRTFLFHDATSIDVQVRGKKRIHGTCSISVPL